MPNKDDMIVDKNKKIIHYQGKFIRFESINGWEYITRHNCKGIVIILAVTRNGKVVLVEQFRPPVGKNVIEFPAGLINDINPQEDESILTAAKRELLEETGYEARDMVKLMEGPISGGASADMVTFVQAIGIKKVAKGGGDATENIKVHEVPFKDIDHWLEDMNTEGCLIEPKVYTGLYLLQKQSTRHS